MGAMSIIGGMILFSTGIDTQSKLNRGGATKAAQRREEIDAARADEGKIAALVD